MRIAIFFNRLLRDIYRRVERLEIVKCRAVARPFSNVYRGRALTASLHDIRSSKGTTTKRLYELIYIRVRTL